MTPGEPPSPQAPVRLTYFLRVPNIGDRMSPAVVGGTTGRQVKWHRGPAHPHLLAIGSLVSAAKHNTYVWGAGLMHPSLGVGGVDPRKILALRGKLTHSELRRHFGALPHVPLGDPGFLLPADLPRPNGQAEYRLGVAAHYVDARHPVIQALCSHPGIVLLDAADPPDRYFEQLTKCDAVVASSLHGLIFAEALGIPNLWVDLPAARERADFKYHDWFTLAQEPQREPVHLDGRQQPSQLIEMCRLHDVTIDKPALTEALTGDALDACSEPARRASLVPLRQCREAAVPIFVISFNRPRALAKVIESYRKLATPTRIIIHDNGSADAETIAALAGLERDGAIVYRNEPIHHADELNTVAQSVARYFRNWSEPARYVVTDCDIDLSIADRNLLAVLDEMLNRFPEAVCAGPMLRIRDVPSSYPLYNHMMNRHISQFWHKEPRRTPTRFGEVAFQEAFIDSTFAMFRADFRFQRKQPGIRLYEPYEALHLDWYGNTEDAFNQTSSPRISHWNNAERRAERTGEELAYSEYNTIWRQADGSLRLFVERTRQRDPEVS